MGAGTVRVMTHKVLEHNLALRYTQFPNLNISTWEVRLEHSSELSSEYLPHGAECVGHY